MSKSQHISIRHVLERRFAIAAQALTTDSAHVDVTLHTSNYGDFQISAAFSLAKTLGTSPATAAARLVELTDMGNLVEDMAVSGAGFITIKVANDYIVESLCQMMDDPTLGVTRPERSLRVLVDYSHPNVAKEMHVGHLRTTLIGDSLVRLHEFLGHEVIRANHLGDWGTPFGMLIEHLRDAGEDVASTQLSSGDLTAFYRKARETFDSDDAFQERARERVVKLQGGDDESLRLWTTLVNTSAAYFQRIYDSLDVSLGQSDIRGESSYNSMLHPIVQELTDKGILHRSDGAVVAYPPGFAGRDGEPMGLIVQKSDGGFGYAATDLAALKYRCVELHCDRILYVVGLPQRLHLAMCFAVARLARWTNARTEIVHVGFGSVLGNDGRMLRTRAGAAVRLSDLIDEAHDRALKLVSSNTNSNPSLDVRSAAHAVAVGAIKFADLSVERTSDYVFDLDSMVSMDGKTGPYIQYEHARARSVLRKVGECDSRSQRKVLSPWSPQERDLALSLLDFGYVVDRCMADFLPHRLAHYVYDVATKFARFYAACPILSAQDPQRSDRLWLTVVAAQVIKTCLNLLGIPAPSEL